MTDKDLELIEQAIKAYRPIHWGMARLLIDEIRRLNVEVLALRTELLAIHAAAREELHEEQEAVHD